MKESVINSGQFIYAIDTDNFIPHSILITGHKLCVNAAIRLEFLCAD
jgi:hypothetical protein